MKRILILLVTLLPLQMGCVSSQMKDIAIETEADAGVDFSAYTSYAWLGSAAVVFDEQGRWEPPGFDADAEIEFLINRELRAHGLFENSTNPQLVVSFAAGIDMESMQVKTDEADEEIRETLENVPMGALVVVLIDANSGKAVWVGVAEAEIQQDPDDELVRKRLDYAVSSMFRKLPR
jgi:hypothetical protein